MTEVEKSHLMLKAPDFWFEKLDQWRGQQIGNPSRPASIRWIVFEYLSAQEAKVKARGRRGRKAT